MREAAQLKGGAEDDAGQRTGGLQRRAGQAALQGRGIRVGCRPGRCPGPRGAVGCSPQGNAQTAVSRPAVIHNESGQPSASTFKPGEPPPSGGGDEVCASMRWPADSSGCPPPRAEGLRGACGRREWPSGCRRGRRACRPLSRAAATGLAGRPRRRLPQRHQAGARNQRTVGQVTAIGETLGQEATAAPAERFQREPGRPISASPNCSVAATTGRAWVPSRHAWLYRAPCGLT